MKYLCIFFVLLLILFSFRGYAADCDGDGIDDGTPITCNVSVFESMGMGFSSGIPLFIQPSSPQTYPVSNIWFNITLDYQLIDKVWITHNFTKTLENYSMNNDTPNNFYYNLDFTPAAGIYEYTFYLNFTNSSVYYVDIGTEGKSIYVIEKNTSTYINLTLDGFEGSKSYNLNQSATFIATLSIPNETINISSNYPCCLNITSNNSSVSNTTNLTEPGFYWLIAYWLGDENYTSASKMYYFDTIAPRHEIKSPPSSETYGPNKTYWFNISWIAATIEEVWFGFKNSTSDFIIYNSSDIQKSSGIYLVNMTDLLVENYTYFWCANRSSTENVTNCTDNITFNVTKDTGTFLMTFDPSTSVQYGVETTVNCSKLKGDTS